MRRNYSFDREIVQRFEQTVPKGARSAVLQELMAKRVAEIQAVERDARIIAGLADMAEVDAELAREWAHVDAESWPGR